MVISILFTLAFHFSLLSLVAFGGVNAVVPDIHHLVTQQFTWMTDQEFTEYFAISRAAPGPNVLFVTLMGWHVAGITGALVATFAICAPSCVLIFFIAQLWKRYEKTTWVLSIKEGVIPLTAGLIAASTFIITTLSIHNSATALLAAFTAILVYTTKINPFYFLFLGMLCGVFGLL